MKQRSLATSGAQRAAGSGRSGMWLVLVLLSVTAAAGLCGARWACSGPGSGAGVEPGAAPRPSAERPGVRSTSSADPAGASSMAVEDADPGRTRSLAPSDPGNAITHRLRGTVLDEARHPVSGATVELSARGVVLSQGTSGEGGAFELGACLNSADPVDVVAHRGGLAARARVDLAGAEPDRSGAVVHDVPTLVLLPAYALRVRLRGLPPDPSGGTLRIELDQWSRSGFDLPLERASDVLLEHLPRGALHLEARYADRAGRVRAFVPEEDLAVIDLTELGATEVWVRSAADGSPVRGAQVEVFEMRRSSAPVTEDMLFPGFGEHWNLIAGTTHVTDARGRVRIDGLLAAVRYEIRVTAPGFLAFSRSHASPRLEPSGASLVVELQRGETRSVRWPIVPGEAPVPQHGATIELVPEPGTSFRDGTLPPSSARMEGTVLVADGIAGEARFLARAPDGSLAGLRSAADDGRGPETSFRQPRLLAVWVNDASGAPVSGATVVLRNRNQGELAPAQRTLATGHVLFEGLLDEPVQVFVTPPGLPSAPRFGGSVDLAVSDGELEVVLKSLARAEIIVRIEGEPRLPPRYSIRGGANATRVVAEDPAAGTLLAEVQGAKAGSRSKLSFVAPGFVTVPLELDFPADGSPARGTVELERTGRIRVRLTGASREPVELAPERTDAFADVSSAAIYLTGAQALRTPNGPDGSFVFVGLAQGRWRVLDLVSRYATDEVELHPGALEAALELHVPALDWVSGRVEVPDPADLARVRVHLVEAGEDPAANPWLAAPNPGTGAALQGSSFRVRLPGDRPVRLVPAHPWLVPAEDGTFLTRSAADGVVLRLVAADELVLVTQQLGPLTEIVSPRIARLSPDTVVLPGGDALGWHAAPVIAGRLRCALPRGRWALWIDPGRGLAPLLLPARAYEGRVEITGVSFEAGSSVIVDLQLSSEQREMRIPSVRIHARSLEGPPYERSAVSLGRDRAVLRGLGPGRFEVLLALDFSNDRMQRHVLELDGRSEQHLVYDLR